jgi:hypothetical protein
LPTAVEFLTQLVLEASSLLPVAHFKLGAAILIEVKAGLPDGGIDFRSDLLLSKPFALPQDLLLLRVHLQPAFGVPTKDLSILRSNVHCPRARASELVRPGQSYSSPSTTSLREGEVRQNNQERCYKEELSSHSAFSSEATSSSRSATTS